MSGHARRRAAAAAAALLGVLALAGCGDGGLDLAAIEERLRADVPERAAERGVSVRTVECPSDADVSPGATFECRVPAVEDGTEVVYTATVTVEDEESASWELTDVRPAAGR